MPEYCGKNMKFWRKHLEQVIDKELKELITEYRPVEKSLVERAFTNFKAMVIRDWQAQWDWTDKPKEIIDKFYGPTGEQVVRAVLSQSEPKIVHVPTEANDPIEIRFPHDLELWELVRTKIKKVHIEIKTTPPGKNYQCLTINKRRWENQVKKHGRPDYVIAAKLKGERIGIPQELRALRTPLDREGLQQCLEWLESWIENYKNTYDAEIVGWIYGYETEKELYDSETCQDWHPCEQDPCYWCYLADRPPLKYMNIFWKKFMLKEIPKPKTELHQKQLFESLKNHL